MGVQHNNGALDDVPTAVAAGYGVAAYAVSFVIVFVLEGSAAVQDFREGFEMGAGSPIEQFGITPPSAFDVSGWLLYGAHNAGLEATVSAMGQSQTLPLPGLEGGRTYLMAVPPLVLVGAGYLLASKEAIPGDSLPKLGASVAVGYVAVSAGGVFLFQWSATFSMMGQEATVTIGPQLFSGILIAGILYPVLFGGVGGFVAQSQASGQRTGHHHPGAHHGATPRQGQQPQYGQQAQHTRQPRQGDQPQYGQQSRASGQPQQDPPSRQGQHSQRDHSVSDQ